MIPVFHLRSRDTCVRISKRYGFNFYLYEFMGSFYIVGDPNDDGEDDRLATNPERLMWEHITNKIERLVIKDICKTTSIDYAGSPAISSTGEEIHNIFSNYKPYLYINANDFASMRKYCKDKFEPNSDRKRLKQGYMGDFFNKSGDQKMKVYVSRDVHIGTYLCLDRDVFESYDDSHPSLESLLEQEDMIGNIHLISL